MWGSVATLSPVNKRSYLSKWIKAIYYLAFCICEGLVCSLALPVLASTLLINFFHGWAGAWNEQMAHFTDEEAEARRKPCTEEGCLSAKEIRTGLIGKLTQMWVKLPQISQDGHPQILPSESIDSDVLSRG